MARHLVAILAVGGLLANGCSESEPSAETATATSTTVAPTEPDDSTTTTDGAVPGGSSIVERFAGEEWFLGTVPEVPVEADEGVEPIRIGMINQEDTPAGSFPELRYAVDAAVNWINAELGGIDGRPIELFTCITQFSVESSQACAQELVLEEVVALVGGLDVLMQGALPVLEQNGIPVIGGIPAGLAEQQSPIVFSFSGGVSGGMAAFVSHAAEQDYERVFIAYGEFDSFEVAARDYAARVAADLGLESRLLSFPIVGADFTSVLNDAKAFDADAVIIAAADTACIPVMERFLDLEFSGQLYLVGACAADSIIASAGGASEGVIFNSEGPPDADDTEGSIFDAVTDEYNSGPAKAAGTVGFRGMMNLYALLEELGPDQISSEAILDLVRSAEDRVSFWGHPYTCDGAQVPGLPSLCAPQQTLFNMTVPGEAEFIGDWIDTVAVFAQAFAQ